MKQLMTGNEAIARGAYEAGVNMHLHILEHQVRKY